MTKRSVRSMDNGGPNLFLRRPFLRRSRKPRLDPFFFCAVVVVFCFSQAGAETTDYGLSAEYAQTVWPAGHRDSANTDYVPVVMARETVVRKRLLEGHPIFWPPISGPGGNLYVSTGKGPGYSNFFAISSEGEVLWQAAPQESIDDLDSWAIINAPTVDRAGDVYVGDMNQLWAFRPDGSVKWVTGLSEYGVDIGFMTVVVSKQGYVGGITTNGKVIFLRPDDGALAVPVLDLPGGPGPPAADTPPRFLWEGLMDPAIKPHIFNLIQGWELEVANTPALHPETGRIYITAGGVEQGSGLLYGIDLLDDRLEIAFQTAMGGGSGTSPAISHDGKRVYALDEAGHMVAVDAHSGELLWQTVEGGGGSASPSVGPDETIYTTFQDHMLAFNPDGTLKWEKSYNDFVAGQLPEVDGLWRLVLTGPVPFMNSLFTVGAKEGWMNIVAGYHLRFMPSGSNRTLVPVPRRSLLVAIDLETGEPIEEPMAIPETSEGFIAPTLDGSQYVTLSGAIASIFYNMLNPFLPARFEVPEEPAAGLLLLEPRSYRALARDGLAWLQELNAEAARAVEDGRNKDALASIRRGTLQLASTGAVLGRAAGRGEITKERRVQTRVALARLARVRQGVVEDLTEEAVATEQRALLVRQLAAAHHLLDELQDSLQ